MCGISITCAVRRCRLLKATFPLCVSIWCHLNNFLACSCNCARISRSLRFWSDVVLSQKWLLGTAVRMSSDVYGDLTLLLHRESNDAGKSDPWHKRTRCRTNTTRSHVISYFQKHLKTSKYKWLTATPVKSWWGPLSHNKRRAGSIAIDSTDCWTKGTSVFRAFQMGKTLLLKWVHAFEFNYCSYKHYEEWAFWCAIRNKMGWEKSVVSPLKVFFKKIYLSFLKYICLKNLN